MKTKYLIGNRHNTRTKYEKMNRHNNKKELSLSNFMRDKLVLFYFTIKK